MFDLIGILDDVALLVPPIVSKNVCKYHNIKLRVMAQFRYNVVLTYRL